jgi:hypothetical protein
MDIAIKEISRKLFFILKSIPRNVPKMMDGRM